MKPVLLESPLPTCCPLLSALLKVSLENLSVASARKLARVTLTQSLPQDSQTLCQGLGELSQHNTFKSQDKSANYQRTRLQTEMFSPVAVMGFGEVTAGEGPCSLPSLEGSAGWKASLPKWWVTEAQGVKS